MIVAIEGLIPSGMNARCLSPSAAQPAAAPINAEIYSPEWLRKQQHQAAGEEPGDAIAAAEAQPAAPQGPEPAPTPANDTSFPNLDGNQPSLANPFINPGSPNWVPDATGCVFDAVLDKGSSLRLPFSSYKRFSGRRR